MSETTKALVERWIKANRYREVGLPTFAETGDALADAIDAHTCLAVALFKEKAGTKVVERIAMWTGGEDTPAWDIKGELKGVLGDIRALEPDTAAELVKLRAEEHLLGFNAGFDGAERAAFERERKRLDDQERRDVRVRLEAAINEITHVPYEVGTTTQNWLMGRAAELQAALDAGENRGER